MGGYSPAPAVKPEEPKKGNIIFLIAAIIALIAIILALAVTCWSGSDEEAAEEVDTALISAETESEAEAPDTAIAEEEPAPVTAAVVEEDEDDDTILRTISTPGFALTVLSIPNSTTITYPMTVSKSDAVAFIDYEIERYGLEEAGVTYSTAVNGCISVHHGELSPERREEVIDQFERDLLLYLSAPAEDAEEEETEAAAVVAVIPAEAETVEDEAVAVAPAEDEAVAVASAETESAETEATPVETEETTTEENVSDAESTVSEETVESTTEETTVTVVEEEPIAEEEGEEWKEIVHSLSLSVSPYSYSYVDFYNGRDAIAGSGVPFSEFGSRYGFSILLGYEWRIVPAFGIGLEVVFNDYFTQRSTLLDGTMYFQVPVLLRAAYHLDGEHLGFMAGINLGLDVSSLTGTNGGYFMAGIELGLSYRFAEHWSFFWKVLGGLTVQTHPVERLYDSLTYAIQPAHIGISCHF